MKMVLLSGGSGKRLWPLSNDSRSKQFLKVLAAPDGTMESMVQRVWRQLEAAGLAESSYVATSKTQVDMLGSQLNQRAHIIVEPERRDTFPAIALTATYLYSVLGISLQEVITILPVDPYVDSAFFHKVKQLESIVTHSGADLALIGVKPTYPSEKYGYIVPESTKISIAGKSYAKVSHFREKPQEQQAVELIEQQALWNCGVFAFKLDYIIQQLQHRGYPIQYEAMLQQYDSMAKISFDYEIVEKAKHLVVTPYDGGWKDLGTWNTLTEEMSHAVIGKGIIGKECENTHLINELHLPVTIMGLSNVVVVASADGILVTDKAVSPRIKDVMKHIEQRPMYEERRWGWYRVIDYSTSKDKQEVLTKRMYVMEGKNLSYQMHSKRNETWTILSGSGEMVMDGLIFPIQAGDVLAIPQGAKHSVRAQTDMDFIEVQIGTEVVEEDAIRLFTEWEEIVQHCLKHTHSEKEIV
jgi:mannose-1-phosphate guanylyltransferase